MKRTINIHGLRARLASNCTTTSNISNGGEAKGDFIIYLADGQQYEVKKGFRLSWGDEEQLIVIESYSSDDMYTSNNESKGFFDNLWEAGKGLVNDMANIWASNKTEIEWVEISKIDSVY